MLNAKVQVAHQKYLQERSGCPGRPQIKHCAIAIIRANAALGTSTDI